MKKQKGKSTFIPEVKVALLQHLFEEAKAHGVPLKSVLQASADGVPLDHLNSIAPRPKAQAGRRAKQLKPVSKLEWPFGMVILTDEFRKVLKRFGAPLFE
jgi:hypothetical protein